MEKCTIEINRYRKSNYSFLISLLLFALLQSTSAFAQPANDNPCNATPLTVGANCNYTNATNANATNTTGVPTPGCASYNGGDVWFSVTVPSTGSITFDSDSQGMTDGGMAVYSGTCSSLSLLACDDDASTNGLMPSLTVSGRTPGTTLWVRFWSYDNLDNGTFRICAQINTPLPPTNQDCPNAIPICQNVYSTAVSYSGEGNIPDEIDPLISCLGSGELNDVWYTFTVQASGNLNFTVTPNNLTEDYDWAVYNLTNASCADIATDPSLSVSCNYSADPGPTGPTGGSSSTSQNPFGTPFNAVIPVTAGQTYVVNVSNYSTSQNGYQIDFGASTATIFDNIPPQLTALSGSIPCGATQLTFDFSENILCNTIQNGDFAVTGPGGPYTLSNWSSTGCAGGGQYGRTVTVNVNPPITTSGNFQFCLTNASASVTDLCGNVAPPSCINFTIDPILVNTNHTNLTCFSNSTGTVTVVPTTGVSPYTYSWTPNVGTTGSLTNLAAGTYTATITDANGCHATTSATITEPTQVTGTINPTQPSCGANNGSATVVPSGGTGPYSYVWSPSGGTGATASNLGSGNFSVTITDSQGCTGSSNITLAAPSSPVAYVSGITNSSCQNPTGNISISVTGGTGPFTYSWSPSGGSGATANNLQPGSYTCVVTDAAGCSSSATATIGTPATVTASISASTPETCPGSLNGTASASQTGGTPGYTYLWSPSGGSAANATGLGAGAYTVTVTDAAGCTSTASVTINSSPVINASVNSTPVLCNGSATGSLTVVASGGNGALTYSWSPSGGTGATASNLTPGTYTVTVTDANGCTMTSSSTLANPVALTNTISSTGSICGQATGSATVVPAGGTAPYSYVWTPAATNSATINNVAAGQYSVVITDANNCTSTATVAVTDLPGPVVALSTQSDVSCNGVPDGSATVQTTGGTAPLTYSWSPSGGTGVTATSLSAGNYSVTVTDANGCTSTVQVTIAQPPVLNTVLTTSANLTCNGSNDGSISVSTSGGTPTYSYVWTPVAANSSTINNLTAGNYSVLVTDLNGCTTTVAATISEPTVVTANIVSTPATCGSTNGSATASASGGAGGYSYLWSPSGGSAAGATNLAAGSYSVVVTDLNGCTASASANVSNIGGPTINAFATANVSCFNGNDGAANSSVSNGTGPFTYLWSPSGGTNASATNLSAGNYSVSVTDANGCTSVANFAITEPPILNAAATSNPVSCFGGANGSASVNVSGGTAGYSYLWTQGSAIVSNPSGLSAGNYSVTITDANGCTTTATTTIATPTALAVSASSQPTLCFGGNDGSATANVSGGTAVYTYSWFPSGGTASNETNLSPGNYTVTVTDANGCTMTAATTVSQPAAISLSTSSTPSTCGSANGTADVVAGGGATPFTYLWSPSGGTSSSAANLAAGSYTVTVTDANGCTMTAGTSVSSLGGPTIATALVNDVACFGGNNGAASSSIVSGTGPFTYSWSPSGGNAANASGLSAGAYSVSVTDANGCTSVANIVIAEPMAMVAQATATPASCFGDASGSANVNIAGGTASYTYLWTPGNIASSNPTGLIAGNYTVTVTDANGCTTTASTTVNQPAQLNVNTTPTAALCNGAANGSAQATVTGGTAGYSYSWFPTGGSAANALNLTAGNYSVTVTDANGCTFSRSVTVTEPPAIALTTSSTSATCGSSNGTATVNAVGGATPYSYLWSPGGGTNATATNLSAITYSVVVTDANGCTTSASESVSNTGGPTIATNLGSNVSCNGQNNGSASVTVSAGTAPFSYQWSPSGGNGQNATNLAAGNYSITVTDANGCISNDNITISEPSVLLNQMSSTDANCAGIGGSATVIVAGGTTPYSYSWSGSPSTSATATGLTGGNYTVTITDGNGCTSTGSTTVNQPGGIVAVPASTPVTCNGGNNGSASVVANGGSGALSYSWSPSGGTGSAASNLTAGNYSVTISDAGGCVSTANIVVTEPTAIIPVTNAIASSCGAANGSASVAVSGGSSPYQYSWSPSGGTSSSANNLSAGNYIVTITDNNGCTSTASALVTNTGGPTVVLNASNDVSCFGGNNGSASVNVTGGTGPFTYTWTPYGGATASASNLAAGNYTVNTADANGCMTAVNVTIGEPNAITIQTSSTPSACGNPNGTATAHGLGGVGNYSYTWTGYASTDSTLSNITSGNYNVTITDGNGCTATTAVNVGISNGANAILQSSTDVSCAGGSDGSAVVSVSGGTAPYSYSWSPSGGTNAGASGLSAGNYVVTVSDANNCSTTVNVVINDGAILVLQTSSTPASCNGGTDGSASVIVNGGSAPYTYQWTGSSSVSATATNLAIGNYNVTVTDANGCAESDVATVNSATAIALNPVSTDLSCNGDQSGTASVSPVGGTPPYSYQWTGNVSTTNSANNLSGGLYTLIVTDANGCASIENFNINEPAAMTLTVSPAITLCIGQNAQLAATVSGGSTPYSYQWSTGASADSISVNPTASTNYTVTVTDANGCLAGTQSISVSLNPPLNITAAGPAGICSGEQVNLTSLATGGNGNYTYSWNNGLFNTANATDSPTTDMTYTVVVTDNCGTPSAMAQVNVIVSPDPTVDFGPGHIRGCAPLTINFDDRSTTLAGSTYTWSFGDSGNSSDQNPEHVYTTAGSYDVTLEVTNSYGCSSVMVVPNLINVFDSPNAQFVSQPEETTILEPSISFTNNSTNADYYTWDFGDGSALVNDINPTHAYADTGTYLVTLITINNAGCADTIRGYVEVGDAFTIYIPNAFTPNFDQVNDHFNASGIGWADFNLYILDRWGLNLYHSTDREKPWDGTFHGEACQADTYVYKIQVHDTKGKLHSFIGHVSLVR